MIFIDESGDDGKTEKSSQRFFVVTALFTSLEKAEIENRKIRSLLSFEKSEMKWNKLNKKQKNVFKTYTKEISYKIDYTFLDKDSDEELNYFDLADSLIKRNILFVRNEFFLYKGEHLKKMFEKLRRKFAVSGVKFKHREVVADEVCGIEIADLWAGYLHKELKSSDI